MDKVQKIREEVEKLKSQLLRGACSSQVAMETRCKEEAYNEVLDILDSLQEEPVSEELGEYINELSKQFPEVSFAKLSRIAVRVAKWQETKDKQILNEEGVVILPEEEFERMKRSLIKLAEREQQMMANAFEGAYIRRNRYTKKNVLNGFDVTCDAIQGFKDKDKVKVIVIKED